MSDITRVLTAIESGDPDAAKRLLPLVYDELRRLAAARMAQEKPGQTLQATALVHEAYLRLAGADAGDQWDSRGHFFAAAARAMRRILVDNARRKGAARHGGDLQRVELADKDLISATEPDQMIALDDAFAKLGKTDPRAAELAELHVFAGLSVSQAADVLGMSRASAYREWTFARARLRADFRKE